MTRRLMRHANGRVVVALEGGYNTRFVVLHVLPGLTAAGSTHSATQASKCLPAWPCLAGCSCSMEPLLTPCSLSVGPDWPSRLHFTFRGAGSRPRALPRACAPCSVRRWRSNRGARVRLSPLPPRPPCPLPPLPHPANWSALAPPCPLGSAQVRLSRERMHLLHFDPMSWLCLTAVARAELVTLTDG